jgi:hypothetical protein
MNRSELFEELLSTASSSKGFVDLYDAEVVDELAGVGMVRMNQRMEQESPMNLVLR